MLFTPHDYQQECIEFLEKVPRAGLLLSMGLGKTSIVLAHLHDLMFSQFKTRKTIVIAPKNVAVIAWPGELKKWDQFRDITYTVLHGPDKDDNLLLNKDLYIINYDGLKWLARQYINPILLPSLPKFDLVVIDESTFVKNQSSKRWTITNALFSGVPRWVLLTGRPSPNGLLDLYGQMELIKPGLLARTKTSYRDAYFLPPNVMSPSAKWLPRKGCKDVIAQKMAPYVKVMREQDVLPRDAAIDNMIYCELPKKFRGEYDKLERDFFLTLDNNINIEVFNASSLSMKLRQYIQGFLYSPEDHSAIPVNAIKAEALKEIVEAQPGRPILCAIQFQHEVDMLRKVFGYRVPALYGKTTEKETEQIIEEWSRGEHPLLLAHPKSGGIGLNLQDGGSTVVWYAQTWDAQDYEQFNCRIDRQGQKEAVILHHIVMRDTVDQMIAEARQHKIWEQGSLMAAIQEYRLKKNWR